MHKVMYPVIKDEHLLLNVYVYKSSVRYQYTCKHVVVLLADNLYNGTTTPHVHVLLIVAMSWRVCVHLQHAVVTYVSLFISLALLSEHVIHLCPPPSCGLQLFYRHTNMDHKVTFIFPGILVKSGEKPVTTEKPKRNPNPGKKVRPGLA